MRFFGAFSIRREAHKLVFVFHGNHAGQKSYFSVQRADGVAFVDRGYPRQIPVMTDIDRRAHSIACAVAGQHENFFFHSSPAKIG